VPRSQSDRKGKEKVKVKFSNLVQPYHTLPSTTVPLISSTTLAEDAGVVDCTAVSSPTTGGVTASTRFSPPLAKVTVAPEARSRSICDTMVETTWESAGVRRIPESHSGVSKCDRVSVAVSDRVREWMLRPTEKNGIDNPSKKDVSTVFAPRLTVVYILTNNDRA
jgi:hypothetical protein